MLNSQVLFYSRIEPADLHSTHTFCFAVELNRQIYTQPIRSALQ